VAYEESAQIVQEEVWFLDCGCNNHMTENKHWFANIEEGFSRTIKIGNDTTMVVVAKGSIRVQIDGISHVISDVYFVHELKTYLQGNFMRKG